MKSSAKASFRVVCFSGVCFCGAGKTADMKNPSPHRITSALVNNSFGRLYILGPGVQNGETIHVSSDFYKLISEKVVMQFDGRSTPKALANASPGLLQPWVRSYTKVLNSEGVPMQTEHVQCFLIFCWIIPRVEAT